LTASVEVKINLVCRIETLSQIGTATNVSHNIKGKPYLATTFTLPAFVAIPKVCAPTITKTLFQIEAGARVALELPIVEELSSNYILDTQDSASLGTHLMELEASIPPSASLDLTGIQWHIERFSILIYSYLGCSSISLKSLRPPTTLYPIGSASVQVPFPTF